MEIGIGTSNFKEFNNDHLVLSPRIDITILFSFFFSVIVIGILSLILPHVPILNESKNLNMFYLFFIFVLIALFFGSLPSLFSQNLIIKGQDIIIAHYFFFIIPYQKEIFNKLDFILKIYHKKEKILGLNDSQTNKKHVCYYLTLVKAGTDETDELRIILKKTLNRIPNNIEKELVIMLEKHGILFDASANNFLHSNLTMYITEQNELLENEIENNSENE